MKKGKKVFCIVEKCLGCRSCEIACAVEHSRSKDLLSAVVEAPVPVARRAVGEGGGIVVSDACHHCADALCVQACMSAAMYKDADGATVHDEDRCVGCWMCVMACPFGSIRRKEKVAVKCDLCPDRESTFACVEACPTGALLVGAAEDVRKKREEKRG